MSNQVSQSRRVDFLHTQVFRRFIVYVLRARLLQMLATVIDTLRYANSLKDAGVDASQAEAMARAINAELTLGLATKADLDHAAAQQKSDLDRAVAQQKGDLDRAVAQQKGDLDRAVAELKGEIDRLDGKIEVQGRYTFLVLALIAALGLYNAAAPHLSQTKPDLPGAASSGVSLATPNAPTPATNPPP